MDVQPRLDLPVWMREIKAKVDPLSQGIARYCRDHTKGQFLADGNGPQYTLSAAATLDDGRVIDLVYYQQVSPRLGDELSQNKTLDPLDFPCLDYFLSITIIPKREDQIGYRTLEKSLFGLLESIYYFDWHDFNIKKGGEGGRKILFRMRDSHSGKITEPSPQEIECYDQYQKKYEKIKEVVLAALEQRGGR